MSFKPKKENQNNNNNNSETTNVASANANAAREREHNEREPVAKNKVNSNERSEREPSSAASEQSEREREQSEREREPSSAAAKANNPFINSEVFIYKVGSIISIYHEFLSFVNGNQFLSDCYYYYNIVNNSPNKRDCVQAKAAHKSIMNHYKVGYGSLSPLLREEFESLASETSETGETSNHLIIKDIDSNDSFLFLPPEFLTSLKSQTRNHKKLSYVLDFIEGIQYLKKTTNILSLIDIRKFI